MEKPAQTVTKAPTGTVRRGASKAPKALQHLIDLANADPALPPLWDRDNYYNVMERALLDPRVWVKVCTSVARAVSSEARKFLGPPGDVQRFTDRYELLRSIGPALRAIATSSVIAEELTVPGRLFASHLKTRVQVSLSLQIDERGVICTSNDLLISTLEGVRADRIRACAIAECSKMFWAARINSECCSLDCRKKYNQRNSRMQKEKLHG
jgi:hypothetical protein